MNKITTKNTLLYVHIPTHFKEIIRVARVMKISGTYVPFVFFITPYEGWERDFNLCQDENIQCIAYFNRDDQTVKQPQSKFKKFLRYIVSGARNNFKKTLKYFTLKLSSFLVLISKSNRYLGKLLNKIKSFSRKLVIKLKNFVHPFVRFFILLFSKKLWARLLLGCYKFAWNNVPQLLPPISRAAHNFYNNIPIILKEKNIQLIVFPEHNLFYFTQITVMIGRKYNIPSIIVPFTIANTIEWSESFYNEPSRSLENNYNKICGYAFPHWVHNYKNRKLLLPIDLVLLHEMFQITPKNPWLLNSGDIDFLASESMAMSDYYIAAGIEERHLRTIGALYNDELYLKSKNAEIDRAQLYRTLQMDADKPMILCALPPNQCAGRGDIIEFKNYEEIVRFILSELSKYTQHYNIIVNLHPRIAPSSVNYINEYPVKIFTGDIAELVPLSSLYVASCSATIRMAVSCGIPVVNYDLYRYRYDDYASLDGVLTLFNREEYSSILEKLIKDTGFYNEVKAIQVKQGSKWGALDGKAGTNLLEQLNLLFEKEIIA